MRLSGKIIDVYDDPTGSVLREFAPSIGDLPGSVKTATPVIGAFRDKLPDSVFALVVQEDGHKMRKFACTDPGNTELSVLYFQRTRGELSEEMRKTAARNLCTACGWYGLEIPEELGKEAGLMDLASKAMRVNQAVGVAKDALGKNQTISAMGGGLYTPRQVQQAQAMMGKMGELTGTALMPSSPRAVTPNPTEAPAKTTLKKSAQDTGVGHVPTGVNTELYNNNSSCLAGTNRIEKMMPRLPQAKTLQPHVDANGVSHGDIAGAGSTKKASRYALNGRYPLDGYDQVKRASAYFDQYAADMDLEDRREYCRNLVKRANELGIDVSDVARSYGAEEVSLATVKESADRRRVLVPTPGMAQAMSMLEKMALDGAPGETLVEAFASVDSSLGLDRLYSQLPNPVLSVYAYEKTAEFSDDVGGWHVMEKDLRCLAMHGRADLCRSFSKDMVDEFAKDPVGIYKSLPREQRILLARLARDCAATHGA